jgi:hypothetical protein
MFDASRLGNHSAQIELIAIKAKHEVPNGRAASGCCRRCVYCRESSSSRVVLSVPSDLAEGRIQVLSDVVCGGSAVEQGRAHREANAPSYVGFPIATSCRRGNIYGAEVGPKRLMKCIGRDDLGRAVVVFRPNRG